MEQNAEIVSNLWEEKLNRTGRFGIVAKSTIKDNPYDSKFSTTESFVTYDQDTVSFSLNKKKRWEEINALKSGEWQEDPADDPSTTKELVEVKVHHRDTVKELSSTAAGFLQPRKGYSGGYWGYCRTGRHFERATICKSCGNEELALTNEEKAEILDKINGGDYVYLKIANEEGDTADADEEPSSSDDDETSNSVTAISNVKNIEQKVGRIIVQLPFKKGEYPLYRQSNRILQRPCMCCFHRDGPMWMLKGMGNKSSKKTKGFKKINRRDIKQSIFDGPTRI